MENREAIIRKVESLLALAGNNPSKNEAISAALKAQELMAKYDIELADVEESHAAEEIVTEVYNPKQSSHYVSKWKYKLASIIARNFRCRVYAVKRKVIVFYGFKNDAKIALQVFGFLFETGNRLAERYYRKCKREGRETKGILNTYLLGFCDGIREVLDKQCTALMLVLPKEVEDSYKEHAKGFSKISNKLSSSNDKRAYTTGRQEGKDTAQAREIEG